MAANDAGLDDQVVLERRRFFVANRWSGPVGIAAATSFYTLLIVASPHPPRHLSLWLGGMLLAVGAMAASFLVPSLAGRIDRYGIPKASNVAFCLVGCGWGSILWLDLDATRSAEVRWITLATLFAVSAGIVAGISGVNLLGAAVFVPMWAGSAGALVAAGQPVAAGAAAAFATITYRDMRRNGRLWIELVSLRVGSHEIAEANVWAATHDLMTSLVNRSGFMQSVTDRAERSDLPISVMFIDLDRFKEVNDHLGHAAGDQVLIEAANRLKASLRATDVVGRFGGDEFCVLLDPKHDEASSDQLAHRIIDVLERPFVGPWGEEHIYISASVGIARLTPAEATPERLLLDADQAMYEAKRTGRRRVVHFDSELRANHVERLGLESDFRRAIREGVIESDAQPMFDMDTGAVRCVELLARWRLPNGGAVPPSVFIPLAEELGLIGDLTDLMLRAAGEQFRAWADHPELGASKISVNVSAADLGRGRLVNAVADVVTEFGIAPNRLVLELTESGEIAGTNNEIAQFEALRTIGVDIAIDDFGSGYSNLEHLLTLPVAAVKLDLSLVQRLGTDPRQIAMLRSIHDLAAVIGHKVIVEGIETAFQFAELKQLGMKIGQGYYLSRPVPAPDLVDHLAMLRSDDENPFAETDLDSESLGRGLAN